MPDADEDIIRLLSHHDRGIRAFVLAITGRADVVDDIVQDVAVVWRRQRLRPRAVVRCVGAWYCAYGHDGGFTQRKTPPTHTNMLHWMRSRVHLQHDAGTYANGDALEHCGGRLSAAHRELLRQRYQGGGLMRRLLRNGVQRPRHEGVGAHSSGPQAMYSISFGGAVMTLAERWLDSDVSDEEVRRLNHVLCEDPAVAHELVAAAVFESELKDIYQRPRRNALDE